MGGVVQVPVLGKKGEMHGIPPADMCTHRHTNRKWRGRETWRLAAESRSKLVEMVWTKTMC